MGDFNEKSLFGSKNFSRSKKKHQQKKQHVEVPVHPTRTTLASNHCFYEVSSEEETSDHSSAPDFNQLINSSVQNVGGHFYFKDEKKAMAAENKEETLKSSLFYIDGKLLQRALATIPFHERLGYELEHFTVDEIEAQERDAAKNEDAYRSLCENRGRDLIINKIRAKSAKKLPEIKKEDPYESRDELEDILEGTKAFKIVVEPIRTSRKTPETRRKTPEPESKENMQKWLDNLLN